MNRIVGLPKGLNAILNVLSNTLKKIIYYILRGRLNLGLTTNYERVKGPGENEIGNYASSATINRYLNGADPFNIKGILEDAAVRDNLYFLENVVGKHISGTGKPKFLDVGCGNGSYSKVFASRRSFLGKLDYYGTEIDEEIVNICHSTNPDRNFIVSYADKISYPNNSFTMVFSSSMLHYTLNKWRQSLREMRRVSKKFVVMTRFPVTKFSKTFYVKQIVDSKYGHEEHYFVVLNREQLERYMRKMGLKILERDYTLEEYRINKVDEKIMLIQYLLEKV